MAENMNKLFTSFIKDIVDVFPEYKKRLTKYYKEILDSETNDHPKIKEFLDNIDEISDKVVDKDITFFNDDPIILQNVSFKLIWNSDDISDQTKNSIWKYLQTFCIININLVSTSEKISEVIKTIESNKKVKDKETFKNMKKLKKLNENFDIKEIGKIVKENPDTIDSGMSQMDELFQNTSIGQIAKEITEDLDIENIVNNGGGIEDLFSGGNMSNIMQSISSKMVEKQDTMDTDNLMKEATNICNTMQGNPLFSSLMGMQGDVMRNMMTPPHEKEQGEQEEKEQKEQKEKEHVKNIQLNNNPSHDPNKTKSRLQQKLKEKQTQKLNVEKKD